MSVDLKKLKSDAAACLHKDKGVTALQECIARSFADLEVYREQDDLVIRHGQRFLIVKRTGAAHFRVTENVAEPSTNIVDAGGGRDRDVAGLIDEIVSLAGA